MSTHKSAAPPPSTPATGPAALRQQSPSVAAAAVLQCARLPYRTLSLFRACTHIRTHAHPHTHDKGNTVAAVQQLQYALQHITPPQKLEAATTPTCCKCNNMQMSMPHALQPTVAKSQEHENTDHASNTQTMLPTQDNYQRQNGHRPSTSALTCGCGGPGGIELVLNGGG